MKRIVYLLLLAFASTLFVPAAFAHAEGVGYFPSEIAAKAMRGQRYTAGSVIINQTSSRRTFRLTGGGDIGSWLSFATEAAPGDSTTSATAEPNSQLRLVVYISVPPTATDGTHTGNILMENYPENGEQSDVVQAFRQGVTVTVSGVEALQLHVGSPIANDVEQGKIFRIQTSVGNEGNADVVPSVGVVIQPVAADGTLSGQPAGHVRSDGEPIPAGKEGTVLASWDTQGQPVGRYRAAVTVSAEGRDFAVRALDFQIVPAGSLARGGRIASMTLVGDPPPGTIARVDISFENSGKTELQGHFVGQVYLGSDIVQETASKIDATADPGQTATISTFFPVQKAGTYTVRGRVQYESVQTDEAVLQFTVGSAGSSGNTLAISVAASVVGLVAVGGGTGFWLRRRRPGGKSEG